MYRYGEMVCGICRKSSKKWYFYYYSRGKHYAMELKKNIIGHYMFLPLNNDEFEVEIKNTPCKKNGLFSHCLITIKNKEGKILEDDVLIDEDRRICPHCYEKKIVRRLPKNAGYYNYYVISMSGRPSSGKTSYISSASRAFSDNGIKAQKIANAEITLNANQLGQREGLENEFLIYDKKKKRVKACVLLVDVPGEVFNRNGVKEDDCNLDEEHVRRIKCNSDAYLYCIENASNNKKDMEWLETLSETKKPLAVVLGKADKIKAEFEQKGLYTEVLTKGYFEMQKTIEGKKGMEEKGSFILKDKQIINYLVPAVKNSVLNEDTGFFFISNGENKENKENLLDLTKQVNVKEPLLFILENLGLYK